MSDAVKVDPIPPTAGGTGVALLAVGGATAAFGAATCCALPVVLGSLGLGSAWLFWLQTLAGPHRTFFLAMGTICLAGATALLVRQGLVASACASRTACKPNSPLRSLTGAGLALGSALLVLAYLVP